MELSGIELVVNDVVKKLKGLGKNHEGIIGIDIDIYTNENGFWCNEINVKYEA